MGRVRRAGEEPDGLTGDPDRLGEDPADGCPGGDQRSWLVQTLLAAYSRRRDAQGNRVSNLRLDRCTDDLIIDAIAYYEEQQDASSSYCHEEYLRKLEREKPSHGT